MFLNTRVWNAAQGRAYCLSLEGATTLHACPQPSFVFAIGDSPVTLTVKGNDDDNQQTCRNLAIGEGAVLAPWKLHRLQPTRPQEKVSILVVSLNAYVAPAISAGSIRRSDDNTSVRQVGCLSSYQDRDLFSLASRLASELVSTQSSTNDQLEMIFSSVCRYYSYWSAGRRSNFDILDYRIRRALVILSDNLTEDVKCGSVANASGLSRPHFFRAFRKHTGLTPKLYFNALRLEKAKSRLIDGQVSIQEIALDLGFSAQSNFTRFFKNHIGVSPNEFRNDITHLGDTTPATLCG
ncbi:helix-turn-helix transcriptional regulator [Rhodobacterales bacterium]|nr:helix-turn-helix transcriptional regulator [Rhodobacterales bacterium]